MVVVGADWEEEEGEKKKKKKEQVGVKEGRKEDLE